jgi:superfamily II DNA or RNA helicase
VPTIDLLYQYKSFLEQHLEWGDGDWDKDAPVDVGQLGDGVVNPQPVTVATVRTAAAAMSVAYTKYEFGEYDDHDDTKVKPSELREWLGNIGTLLIDEAHILGAQTVYDIATKLTAPNKYGMSASPWRDDGADLMIEAATGPVISRISAKKLVDENYLVPPIIEVVSTDGWWTPAAWGQTCTHCGRMREMHARGPAAKCSCGNSRWRSEFTDAYRAEIVENEIRNMRIAEIVNDLPGPTLVLVKQIKHGKLLEPLIPGCRFLSGKDPGVERVGVYDDIREGRLRVIVATTIADMGLDVPALRNLVLAGGGKSSTRHLQRIGRVARPYPGKTHARVIDFDDSHVHRWFKDHAKARRKIEHAEWGNAALWV